MCRNHILGMGENEFSVAIIIIDNIFLGVLGCIFRSSFQSRDQFDSSTRAECWTMITTPYENLVLVLTMPFIYT